MILAWPNIIVHKGNIVQDATVEKKIIIICDPFWGNLPKKLSVTAYLSYGASFDVILSETHTGFDDIATNSALDSRMKFREKQKLITHGLRVCLYRVNGVSIDYLEMDY